MPPKRRTRTSRTSRATPPPLGPYDLSTVKLPFGTELDALGAGFSRERAKLGGQTAGRRDGRIIGHQKVATIVNRNVLADGHAAWILADARTGLLRAQTAQQLFEGDVKTEMVEQFSSDGSEITPAEFARGHAWKKALGVPKHQPLTGLLKNIGKDYVRLNDNVYLHHRSEALPVAAAAAAFETPRRAPRQPDPPQLTWSPGDYAANFMGW